MNLEKLYAEHLAAFSGDLGDLGDKEKVISFAAFCLHKVEGRKLWVFTKTKGGKLEVLKAFPMKPELSDILLYPEFEDFTPKQMKFWMESGELTIGGSHFSILKVEI